MLIKKTKHFIDGDVVSFDTETTGLDPWHGDAPFAFSFSNLNGDTAYFEFAVDPFTRKVKAEPTILGKIKQLLEDDRITKVCHNAKFDVRMVETAYGIHVAGPGGPVAGGGRIHETMFMAFTNNTLEPSYGLKQLSDKYLGIDTTDQDQLKKVTNRLRRHAKKWGWKIANLELPSIEGPPKLKAQVEADYWLAGTMARQGKLPKGFEGTEDLCRKYAELDAVRTILLYQMYKEIAEEQGTKSIYDFEMSLWPVIYGMESRGPAVDPKKISESKENSIKRAILFKEEIAKHPQVWPGFSPNNHHHVRKLVMNKLKMEFPLNAETTMTGLPKVGREFLQANLHVPVIMAIAKYRTAVKTFGSFFSRFERFMSPCRFTPRTFAIHANFQQIGPATGRLSCRDPNLQNVMDPTVSFAIDPQHVRHVFMPRPGYRWLCVDYSNMEVRMFAGIAEEPTMLRAIETGEDIHSNVANRIWGGDGNSMGVRQVIRALQLDGTGVGSSAEVTNLWKQWGIKDASRLGESDRYRIAWDYFKTFGYDIVKCQDSVGRRYARNIGKMVTFLKIYGGGMPGARRLLKDDRGITLPDDDIREILMGYDRSMPRVREYSEELISRAKREGCIWTLWDRRLSIDPDAPYRAVNYMIQGSSADLMKSAMVRVNAWLRREGCDGHILMTIHDELIIEIAETDMTKRLIREVCRIMEDTEGRLPIPMIAEPKVVIENWSLKKKVA